MKKLAIINDLTGYGRCSLAVAIPVVSVMGVQACPIPTAVYSNHMAFPLWQRTDFSPYLAGYLDCYEQLDLSFDGILCGFLGNEAQVSCLEDFFHFQKKNGTPFITVDPVMGDHGRLYSSVTPAYFDAIKKLLTHADLVTPNLTEGCLLADEAYPADTPDEVLLQRICEKLHAMGPERIVITGIAKGTLIQNYVSEEGNGQFISAQTGGPSRPGTGDLFASIVAADTLNGAPLALAVKKAAEFVRICIEDSTALDIPIIEGVCFERHLRQLL